MANYQNQNYNLIVIGMWISIVKNLASPHKHLFLTQIIIVSQHWTVLSLSTGAHGESGC